MKKLVLSFLLISGYLINPSYSKSNQIQITETKNNHDTVLISNQKAHEFSTTGKQDKFIITMRGNNPISGSVVFKIINYAGKEIYNINFQGRDLLGNAFELKTKKHQADYILKSIKNFFSEDKFKKPAIEANEKPDTDYSDKSYWSEIKADRTAIAFFYLIGYEDGRHIAYSKKSKKVVLFYNCC